MFDVRLGYRSITVRTIVSIDACTVIFVGRRYSLLGSGVPGQILRARKSFSDPRRTARVRWYRFAETIPFLASLEYIYTRINTKESAASHPDRVGFRPVIRIHSDFIQKINVQRGIPSRFAVDEPSTNRRRRGSSVLGVSSL